MNLICVRYFDDMYVVIPLVVSCECRLHYTLYHNTYAFSLLFYKVYMKRENAGSWNSGLEKEQIFVARYKLSYHKTICYHLFQYLQRIPCWKPLIISFCSSLGLTLLLIERTTIDPLYLWVIKTLFWRRFRGVKRLW